ncbi:hypothetical protein AAU61_00275 [Desulfocarbo indianensis]|nr:hypothetical protein AAU61_00275 [Desulfocarbo indianensis]
MKSFPRKLISVIGAGSPDAQARQWAQEVGGLVARRGFGLVCGGLGGVMEAACRGCAEAGGLTVGILPGVDAAQANPWVQVVIPTGLGQARNVLVVMAGCGAIAVAGGPGTLSEIGHAIKMGRPVVGLGTWALPGLAEADTPEEAVELLFDRLHC